MEDALTAARRDTTREYAVEMLARADYDPMLALENLLHTPVSVSWTGAANSLLFDRLLTVSLFFFIF